MVLSLFRMVLAHPAALIAALAAALAADSPESRFHPATALQFRVFQRFPLKSATRLDSQSALVSVARPRRAFKL